MGLSWASALIILWSQVQVLVGPPKMKIPTFGLVIFLSVTLSNAGHAKKCVGNCYTLPMAMPLDFALRGCFSPEE